MVHKGLPIQYTQGHGTKIIKPYTRCAQLQIKGRATLESTGRKGIQWAIRTDCGATWMEEVGLEGVL